MGSLFNYIIRRVLFAVPVFLAVSIITFLVTNAAGDPVQIVRLGIRNLNPAQLKAIQDYFHVNEPLYTRYFLWLSDLIRGKDRKSTRLNSSHGYISYAVFCLKKKKTASIQLQILTYSSVL